MTTTGKGSGANWRRRFFYAAELVFAIIGGVGEAAIYYAYLPAGIGRWPEAIARATITQIAIILFGVAAVQAAQRARGGMLAKVVATIPANIATGVFSLVAFWFLRDAAIIFRDGSYLAPAEAFNLPLPNGYVLTGQTIDIYLIAALPLFQVGLNWLAPLIVQDAVVETEDERQQREARELAALAFERHRQAILGDIKAVKATGRRKQVMAFAGRDADDHPTQDDAAADASAEANGGDQVGQDEPTTGGKNGRSGRTKGRHQLREVASGMWTASDLIRYASEHYGVEMNDAEAVNAMRSLPEVERMEGVRGNPYAAPKRTVKAWADRKYRDASTIQLNAG